MKRIKTPLSAAPMLLALGCTISEPSNTVQYESSSTMGQWRRAPEPEAGGRTASPPDVEPTPPDSEPTPPDGEPTPPDGEPMPPDGEPTPPDGEPTPPDGGLTPQLTVMSLPQHLQRDSSGRIPDDCAWGPKNMGAIWVETVDGEIVKSLEVWRDHRDHGRHLVTYNEACACSVPDPVDVITSVTLAKHRTHTATWDLTDLKGTRVPDGAYVLKVEVADYDVAGRDEKDEKKGPCGDPGATNAVLTIELDTKNPEDMELPDEKFYRDIKLEWR